MAAAQKAALQASVSQIAFHSLIFSHQEKQSNVQDCEADSRNLPSIQFFWITNADIDKIN